MKDSSSTAQLQSISAVELSNVTKSFGDVVAVDNLSLSVEDGEFFSLLGPSGCGKTTTLRMIAGFEQPTTGQVHIKGQPMVGIPPYRRPVNTVFQNYALFPHMTVHENVAFGLEMKKIPKDEIVRRVDEILQLVHLPGMGYRKPKQLSGGQQQRVALARALVNRPRVLLLDEPLGALDLKLRKAMQLELKQIQAEVGITFIYVTHDQEEALTMSNRIAVMNDGLVQQIGRPKDIYEHPANRFVADFIGETNFIDGIVASAGEPTLIRIGSTDVLGVTEGREVAADQKVTLAIRPEKLTLFPRGEVKPAKTAFNDKEFEDLVAESPKSSAAASTSGKNERNHVLVEGQVIEVIYIGTDTRYLVQIEQEASVYVRMQNLGARYDAKFQVDDEVFVHWLVDNAQVLVE